MNIYLCFVALTLCLTQISFSLADDDRGNRGHFVPPICRKPKIEFGCKEKKTRWFYDAEDRNCRKFHGCVGVGNNFPTEDSCEDICEEQSSPCRGVRCDRCEKCFAGRCVPEPFCEDRFPFRPFRPFPFRPFRPFDRFRPVFPVGESCVGRTCARCEACIGGQCVRLPGCTFDCANIQCGECQRCEDGACIHTQGCIPSSPIDPCAGVSCPDCTTCGGGQCIPIPGCNGFPVVEERECRGFGGCGPCRSCVFGRCKWDGSCRAPFFKSFFEKRFDRDGDRKRDDDDNDHRRRRDDDDDDDK